MDIRQKFTFRHLKDPEARILELGPLNRPIVDKGNYPNSRYCDIRSTEEVRTLYSGNAYLEATGIWVDTQTIVEIDDVICGSYSDTYAGKEKFDAVIASHVLEHMDDLIFSLRDIAGILKPGGRFIIVYPDKRYCFDHFRTSASIRDAYTVFRYGAKHNTPMVLDFYLNAIHENSPFIFWDGDDLTHLLPVGNEEKSLALYEKAFDGERMDDVHYWPFTDRDFLLFLRDCVRLKLLPFRCIDFLPTQENDQQFFVTLEYDPSILEHSQSATESFERWIPEAIPSYYTSKIKNEHVLCEQQAQQLVQMKNKLELLGKQLEITRDRVSELYQGAEQKDSLLGQKDQLLAEKDSLLVQKDQLLAEKDSLLVQKDQLLAEKDSLLVQKDQLLAEKNDLLEQKDRSLIEKDNLLGQKEHLLSEKNELIIRNNVMLEETSMRLNEAISKTDGLQHVLQDKITRIIELESIENSTIWCVTKPIRVVLDYIKRMLKGSN